MNEELQPDGDLTPEQQRRADALSGEQISLIDAALLGNCESRWRKAAMVNGLAMQAVGEEFPEIPDVFYSQRVKELVARATRTIWRFGIHAS